MGGPAQIEPGGGSEKITREMIRDQMGQLKAVISGIPVPTTAASAQLTEAMKNAEGLVRDLMKMAEHIDVMFGRSVAGETADILKEIGRMRAQLGAIGGEQVAGVNQRYYHQTQALDAQLQQVETTLRDGSLPEAKDQFAGAQKGMEKLSDAMSTARSLFSAGAPSALLSATDRALELFNSGETKRAELILKAAGIYTDNREFFSIDAGKPGAAQLVQFVKSVSDTSQQVDLEAADRVLEKFGNVLAYPPYQRTADRDAIAKSGAVLGAATSQKIVATLDELFAKDDVMRARLLAGMTLAYTGMTADAKATPEYATMKSALIRYADKSEPEAVYQFMQSYTEAVRSGQERELKRSYSEISQKFAGNIPWMKGLEPGRVPLGAPKADGSPPDSVELAKLREFEKSSPSLKGPTMDQILRAGGRAVQVGDMDAYAKSMDALSKRLSAVSTGYFRNQMAESIDLLENGIESIKKGYGGAIPRNDGLRLETLREGLQEFSQALRGGMEMDEVIPKLRYDALCNAFKREQALVMVWNQERTNDNYLTMTRASMAITYLRESGEHLGQAKNALLNGETQKAREEYEEAMSRRQTALAVFSAFGKEKGLGTGGITKAFDPWREAHMSIFDGVLDGKDTTKLQQATGMVELSVFAVPENARGFVDFSTSQRTIRELSLSGRTAEAEAEWAGMQKTLQVQKFWSNAAMTVTGIAMAFVPGGQIISGAIFVSMAANQAMDEAWVGHVSGGTWAMLGVSVATWGLGGVVAELRTAASLARAGGKIKAATAYGTTATVLTGAGIGTGVVMGALTIPSTIKAFQEGRYGEASFNLAMTLFPFAHMAGANVVGKINAERARSAEAFGREVKALQAPSVTAPAPKIVEVPAPAQIPKPAPVKAAAAARRTPQQVYDNYAKEKGGGMLPADISEREWAYVRSRSNGATHEEATTMLSGTATAPTTSQRMRQHAEAIEARNRVRGQDVESLTKKAIEDAVWEQGGSANWMVGNSDLAGENASTGRILRGAEGGMNKLVQGGKDLDCFVISGDKAKLNQINQLLGRGYGDRALEAYRALFKRSVYDACGEGSAFLIRPSQSGDEAIGIIVVDGGRGKEAHARFVAALERNTQIIFDEFMDPAHKQSLAGVRDMVREPMDLVKEVIDVSPVVSVRRGPGGKITATNADGSDAMVTHDIEVPGGKENVTEFLPKLVRSTDEQGSASHAPDMRTKLNSGVDTEIRKAKNIGEVAKGEIVSGMPFEIRLEITDPAILADARGLLAKTRKGLAETLTNRFGIRGLNTFLGHYGANHAVNVVEDAVGGYAAEHNLTIRRLGTMKYIVENGTPQQVQAFNKHVSGRLQQAGMKFRVSGEGQVGAPMVNVSADDALASISNGHLNMNWRGPAYEDANALISAMAIGNDETLLRLLGGRFRDLRPIADLIRKNPAIRNVEDLLLTLRDPALGGRGGPVMESRFVAFVGGARRQFRANLDVLAPPLREAEALRKAAGAEETILQQVPETRLRPRTGPISMTLDAQELERTIGEKPRGRELEGSLNRLKSPEEVAVARVIDAILSGEIKGKLPPEYQRVVNDMARGGRGKAGWGAAAAERTMLALSYVEDVIGTMTIQALEDAMKARSIRGNLRSDALALFKMFKGMTLEQSDLRMNEQDCIAVADLIKGGKSEADAVIEVVTAKAAAYERASAALPGAAQAANLRRTETELANTILRWYYGKQMSVADQHAITDEVMDRMDRELQKGKTEMEAIVAAAKEVQAVPKGFDERLAPLSGLEVQVPGTRQTATPWKMVPEAERTGYAPEVWEVYRESYGKAGLPYSNPEQLLERLPMWMVATDEGGKVLGFTSFSSTKRGTRLGIGGAAPGSRLGRAAVRDMYAGFGKLDGVYGMVSARPAEIAVGSGTPVVPFNEAQRLMGKPKGAKFAGAQRDVSKIRQMDGYRESKVVTDAAMRTGRKPEELSFDDLVEQAVLNRDMPNTAEARGNCFAVEQSINNKPTVVIKIMVGKPLAEKKG